jgi:hypothetical protein
MNDTLQDLKREKEREANLDGAAGNSGAQGASKP